LVRLGVNELKMEKIGDGHVATHLLHHHVRQKSSRTKITNSRLSGYD